MNTKKQMYAVLTGDVIDSSKLEPRELKSVMQRLRDDAAKLASVFPDTVCGKLDVFGGDGWQMLMQRCDLSFRAALFLRAEVKSLEKLKIDTRAAIAWGAVNEDTLNLERVSESTGEAFTASGHLLEEMPKRSRLLLRTGETLPESLFLGSAVSLVDELAARWTPRQAQTLALALLNHSQKEIASMIDRSQPTVQKTLQRAGWKGVEELLGQIEHRPQRL